MRRLQLRPFLQAARLAGSNVSPAAGESASFMTAAYRSGATCPLALHVPRQEQSWIFTSAAALAAATATGYGSQRVRLASDDLEPEALQDLARDLLKGSASDKERAVSMLNSLTIYVDHHDAILRTPGVLEALMDAVTSPNLVPQVRNIALMCTADLMKAKEAHGIAVQSPEFLKHLLAALQAEGNWKEGVDQGQVAQAQAARLCAELAGDPETHDALMRSAIAEQLAIQAASLVHEHGSVASKYSSMAAVPGSMDAVAAQEEERFVAASLFGLAGSQQGAELLCSKPDTLEAAAEWAGNSKDPILQRWGVGALAKLVAHSPACRSNVARTGGLQSLLSALNCGDPQAQCFATAAIGSIASSGDGLASSLAEQGLGAALAKMLQADNMGPSQGVKQGVRRCALRCISACAANPQLRDALQQAGVGEVVQALLQQGQLESDELQQLAQAAVQRL